MHLWLIPALPFVGFLINGIFGRKLSKTVIKEPDGTPTFVVLRRTRVS